MQPETFMPLPGPQPERRGKNLGFFGSFRTWGLYLKIHPLTKYRGTRILVYNEWLTLVN